MNGGRRCWRNRISPVGGISVRGSIPAMYRAKPRTTSSRIHGTTLPGGTFPVLVGASRKRFLGNLLAGPDGTPRPFGDCDGATVAITALAAAAGAWCVRVHQVPLNADAVRVAAAWRDAASAGAAGPPRPGVRAATGQP